MWGVNAYNYLEERHPDLWMIEANSTYRGWFTGGLQQGEWSNDGFVRTHVAGRGALGQFFASLLDGRIKMGDSPPVAYLLHGTPEDPRSPSWGGSFVPAWENRKTVFEKWTTEEDEVEVFGVVEFALPVPAGMTSTHAAQVVFDNRVPVAVFNDGRRLRFRFSPRDAKVWTYVMHSDFPGLNGRAGRFTAVSPGPAKVRQVSRRHTHWWTDDQDPALAEGIHAGARTVSRWRVEFLSDFAARLQRLAVPEAKPSRSEGRP
jgi:hypothetical protein